MPVAYPEGQERVPLTYRTTAARRAALKKARINGKVVKTFGDILIASIAGESVDIPSANPRHSTAPVVLKYFVPVEVKEAVAAKALEAGLPLQQFLDKAQFGEITPRKNVAKKNIRPRRITYLLNPDESDVVDGWMLLIGAGETVHQSAKHAFLEKVTADLESHFEKMADNTIDDS